MDIYTYNMLLSMQHRDITPEDYEARYPPVVGCRGVGV